MYCTCTETALHPIGRIELFFFFSELIIMVLEDLNSKCEYYVDQVLFLTEVIKNSWKYKSSWTTIVENKQKRLIYQLRRFSRTYLFTFLQFKQWQNVVILHTWTQNSRSKRYAFFSNRYAFSLQSWAINLPLLLCSKAQCEKNLWLLTKLCEEHLKNSHAYVLLSSSHFATLICKLAAMVSYDEGMCGSFWSEI